jgi:hypothetical protein
MKKLPMRDVRVSVMSLFLLVMPAMVYAQSEQPKAGPPPIAQQLVREGDFAIKLHAALGLGTAEDEAEAESRLGEAGISPRNGWIADYPVTPDIVGELQKAVGDAADAGKISMGKDEALKRLDGVNAELSLAVKPQTPEIVKTYEPVAEEAKNYPDPTVINNYYYNEGPPVVTYYAPPPDYYYLYAWVPSPFWWYDFWFPGFFVLRDFHRTVFVNQRVFFVSNHFNDVRGHRVFRVDPVSRFRGRTFAGIGVSNRRGFISTGVPRSERTIFNGPRTRMPSGTRTFSAPSRGGRTVAPPSRGGRTISPAPRSGKTISPPAGGGRSVGPSMRGGRTGGSTSRGGGGAIERGQRR